jgi:DNA-binding CsgD family transcriptional regulator
VLPAENYADIEVLAYEAAIIPELWPRALGRLGDISDSVGGGIVCLNERGTHIVCVPEMDQARLQILEGGYMTRSGRAAGVIERGLVGAPRFLNEYDFYGGLDGAEQDPIVVEVFRKQGMGWAAGWVNQTPHGDMIVMNVEQYYERGPIVGDALARLDSVYSVFARAVTLASRVGFERVKTAIETLTAVGLPAAALTPKSRVALVNPDFAAASHIWTTRGKDQLALLDPVANQMLSNALDALNHTGAPRSIPVRATLGGPVTAVVQVVPVKRQAHDVFGNTAALVVLSEPKSHSPDASLVQALFDLTPAEIAVAQAISAGHSPYNIAKSTGRSVTTVRNQLKSVMGKTGCRRQVELVLLMHQLVHGTP